MKINAVFIPSEDSGGGKKLCEICRVYYQHIGGLYRCPQCGEQGAKVELGKKVLKADNHEPMIASKKDPKQKRSPDFPAGAEILSDEEAV